VAVGNAALLKDRGVASADLEARADTLRKDGATALFVAVDDKPAGIIAVADPIKATTWPRSMLYAKRDCGSSC
jgi:Cu+-exporting ATPase